MLLWKTCVLLVRAILVRGLLEKSLMLFLNSKVPSSLLLMNYSGDKDVSYFSAGRLGSFYSVTEFLRQYPTASQNCVAFQLKHLELVIVEELRFRMMQKVMVKLSHCIRRASWRPIVVFQLILDSELDEELSKSQPFRELISLSRVPLDSSMFVLTKQPYECKTGQLKQKENTTVIWEVYTIKQIPFVKRLKVITMDPKGFDTIEVMTYIRGVAFRRNNFYGAVINGVTQNDPSYSLESRLKVENGTVRFAGGVSVRMFQDLEFALNFTYMGNASFLNVVDKMTIEVWDLRGRPIQGKGWLAKDKVTGQWIGVGKQVISGAADVCVSLLAHNDIRGDTNSRLQILIPTLRGKIQAFFKQPDSSDLRDIFMHPLGFHVWMLTGCLLIFTLLLIKVSTLVKNYVRGKPEEESCELEKNPVLVLLAMACQQGWLVNPSATSMKIVSFYISLATFILYVSFSASIVSTLTLELVPIRNFKALVASHLILVGDIVVPKVSSILQERYGTSDAILQERGILYDIDKKSPYERILEGKYATIGLTDEFISLFRRMNGTGQEYCTTVSAVKVGGEVYSSMFVTKGSPLKELFNFGILNTMERGLNSCRFRRYNRKAHIKCDARNTRYRNDLGLADVMSAYIILGAGYVLSVALLAVEKIVIRCRARLYRQHAFPENDFASHCSDYPSR